MRNRSWLMIACLVGSGFSWIACGGDDAAVSSDSGANDATAGDASNGDSGAPDANDGGCNIPIPGVPPGKIYCSGDPAGCDVDASYCCATQCKPLGQLCIAGGGSAECTRPTDCATGVCCAKLAGTIDLEAGTCPATAKIDQFTCAGANQRCAVQNDRVCVHDSDCDAGSCIPVAATIADGGTTIGLCAP